MRATKPFISPSQVSSYTRCGEAYRRRYIEREIIPPGIALIKGTALHKGAEVNFSQKIKSKLDLPTKHVVEAAVDTLKNVVQREGLFMTKDEQLIGKTKIVGQATDRVAATTTLLMTAVAPRTQPTAVENEIKIEIPESSHDLVGILDLTCGEYITDVKTSSKTWTQEQADQSSQMTFYAMLYRGQTGRDPAGISIENIVDKKEPEAVQLTTSRTMADYTPMFHRINAVVNAVNMGNFPPATDGAWWCSARFCGYWATCRYINHG